MPNLDAILSLPWPHPGHPVSCIVAAVEGLVASRASRCAHAASREKHDPRRLPRLHVCCIVCVIACLAPAAVNPKGRRRADEQVKRTLTRPFYSGQQVGSRQASKASRLWWIAEKLVSR